MPIAAASTAHMALKTVSSATTADTKSKLCRVFCSSGEKTLFNESTRESFSSSDNVFVRRKKVSYLWSSEVMIPKFCIFVSS